ncbi:TOBE domain-containing protein [Massilia forsythiae]|uniref:TOBE domain-containing protein n=1 Tax=Massilia forsythiae TaxID=2728020 RepID=A0A7Z2VVP4_9BURK|nr:TOBE domain-containing protein [Massilia forsythiae]QJE00034.1 TOBE domain-containing protein [Massilia forsythiae]
MEQADEQRAQHGFALQGTVWMTVGDENFGGPGRIALLAKIAETGSISQAAKAIKMSYKAAWDAIDAMNNLAGEALVQRLAGGKGGGGTRLTPRGEQLVKNFKAVEQVHRDFVQQLNRQAAGIADDLALIGRLNIKTSARNQFFGTVCRVVKGAVNDEIELDIAGGQRLVAIVTRESTETLGLDIGRQAFALIKSSSVILVTDAEGARFSARNRLQGTISRLTPGAVNTEVVLDLPGDGTVAAVITNDSAAALGLAEGQQAMAMFKASSVIVGVPG